MNSSIRIFTQAMSACFVLFLITDELHAQINTNSSGLLSLPNNPPVGIGTQPYGAPQNSLEIHFDPSYSPVWEAIIRLSENDSTANTPNWAALGLLPYPDTASDTSLSSLARAGDLILHNNQSGDIIITNYTKPSTTEYFGTAIRFATTGDTLQRPFPGPGHHDLERLTINGNGNIGIDLPPDTSANYIGLDSARDQVQIGGGSVIPPPPLDPGYLDPIPGLTMYGGNRFEGLMQSDGVQYPLDWRYIAFNKYVNHSDSSAGRSYRMARMSSSSISFAESAGGLLNLSCFPYSSTLGQNDFSKHLTLQLTGNEGMQLWFMDTTANPYHHLFDVYVPGDLPWAVTRNTNGLSFFHTPLYIGSDSGGSADVDFTHLAGIYPDIGDDTTWMLAVNGAALFKEAWVNTNDWPDYVLLPGYKLRSIDDFGNYIETKHHLPDIPPAQSMNAGIPLGKTEAAITKQVEEMALYLVQLSKQNEDLSKKNEELTQKFDTLEKEFGELKNQKEK